MLVQYLGSWFHFRVKRFVLSILHWTYELNDLDAFSDEPKVKAIAVLGFYVDSTIYRHRRTHLRLYTENTGPENWEKFLRWNNSNTNTHIYAHSTQHTTQLSGVNHVNYVIRIPKWKQSWNWTGSRRLSSVMYVLCGAYALWTQSRQNVYTANEFVLHLLVCHLFLSSLFPSISLRREPFFLCFLLILPLFWSLFRQSTTLTTIFRISTQAHPLVHTLPHSC